MPENEAKTHHGIGEGMVNPVAPPLDYSFLDLKNAEGDGSAIVLRGRIVVSLGVTRWVAELLNEDPRSGLELLRREEEEVLADSKPDKARPSCVQSPLRSADPSTELPYCTLRLAATG
jgi:hypothetical protein